MNNPEFDKAVKTLMDKSPTGWALLLLKYQYWDGAMKLGTYWKNELNDEWAHSNIVDFSLLDIFDDYRKREYEKLDKPWSSIDIIVKQGGAYEVEFGYGEPKMYETL